MDNRMDGGGNEQVSSQPPSGMPGFQPTQADRSGTEALRSNDYEGSEARDADATLHSGGTEFRSSESSGSQSSSGSQFGSLQQSDDTNTQSMGDTSKWIEMRDRVMETMRRNPVPLALGIAGVAALLLSLRGSRTRREG